MPQWIGNVYYRVCFLLAQITASSHLRGVFCTTLRTDSEGMLSHSYVRICASLCTVCYKLGGLKNRRLSCPKHAQWDSAPDQVIA